MSRNKKFFLLSLGSAFGAMACIAYLASAATSTRLDTLNVKGATKIGGTLAVTGAATFNGANTFNGTVGVSGVSAHQALVTNSSNKVSGVSPGTTGNVFVSDGTDWTSGTVPSSSAPASYSILNAGLATSVGASAMTIALKQADGSTNPASGGGAVVIPFNSVTAPSGQVLSRSVTGSLSVTIPSGATMGSANSVGQIYYVWALDNAGTVELAVSGSNIFDESAPQNTTTMGSGSDSGVVMYSTTGRTGVSVRLLGTFLATEATAGTWATDSSRISLSRRVIPEYAAAESNSKTPAGAGNFHQMTGNSITLTPGIWNVGHRAYFDESGAAGYADTFYTITTGNGADSGSEPTNISASGNITIQAGPASPNRLGRNSITGRHETGATDMPLRLLVNTTTTIYNVPYSNHVTSANARITTAIWAERITR